AGLAALTHLAGELQTGDEIGTRGSAVALAEQDFELPGGCDRVSIVDRADLIDDIEQETRLDLRAADTFDQGRLGCADGAIPRSPAFGECATAGFGHAQACRQA